MSWSSPRLITAPSAKNKSLNSNAVVPKAAPSEASGTKAVVAVIVVPCTVLVEVIAPEPTVPAKVTFAPLKVAAVVVPDLIIRSPDVLSKLPKVVPASFKNIVSPAASSIISPEESSVISVPSFVIVSRAMLPYGI